MINNIKDLEKTLNKYLIKALELTRDEIFEVVFKKVEDYYNEPVFSSLDPTEPAFYERTYKLMESLTASHIKTIGNTYSFTVGWDNDYLSFRYKRGFVTHKHGNTYNGITGLQVLESMDNMEHGIIVGGTHFFFSEALNELGREAGITSLFKKNCKKVGIPIK